MPGDQNVLFLSYCHEQRDICSQLVGQVTQRAENRGYEVWWDKTLRAGREWRPEIAEMVSRTRACIFLASRGAMHSSFIWEQEIRPMRGAGVTVAPLYAGAFDWEAYDEIEPLTFLEPFDDGRPLESMEPPELELALATVSKGLDSWLPEPGGVSPAPPTTAPRARVTRSTPRFPPGQLYGVPALPHDYQARTDILDRFRHELLAAADGVAAITAQPGSGARASSLGVAGEGGTGKSVMAAALAHDHQVRSSFPDGVMWVTIGKTRRNAEAAQETLGRWVGCDLAGLRTNRDRQRALAQAFASRRSLVIVDDIWSAAVAEEFDVAGGLTRVLYTTRQERLLTHAAVPATPLRLQRLDPAERLGFLARLTGQAEPLPPDAELVAEQTHGLVLALSLAAGAFRHGRGWRDLSARFRESSRLYPDEIVGNLRAMRVAVSMLDETEHRAYCDLVVFPHNTLVPVETIERYLTYSGVAAPSELLTKFGMAESRLLEVDGDHVRFHDDQLFYLQASTPAQASRHAQLLECFAPPDGWSHLDPEDEYMWGHLVYHLIEAEDHGEAETLLTDMRWACHRLARFGPGAVDDDFSGLCALASDPRGQRVRRRLAQSAHLLAGVPTAAGLANTLALLTADLVGNATHALRPLAGHWWFAAVTPTWFESDALVKIFNGHDGGVTAIVGIAVERRRRVASSGTDGTVRIWEQDVPDSQARVVRSADGPTAHDGPVRALCVATLDSQEMLASAGDDRRIRLWLIDDLHLAPIVLRAHTSSVRAIAGITEHPLFFLASGGVDRTVRLWYRDLGRTPLKLRQHNATVLGIAVNDDGSGLLIATASSDGKRVLWREGPPGEFRPVAPPRFDYASDRGAACLTVGPMGMYAVASHGNGVLARDITGRSGYYGLGPFASNVTSVAPVPGGLAIGLEDGFVHRWEWGWPTTTFESYAGHTGAITGVTPLHGEPSLLASASVDGSARVWDPARSDAPGTTSAARVSRIAAVDIGVAASQRFLAVATEERRIRAFGLDDSGLHLSAEHHAAVHAVQVVMDSSGPSVVIGDSNGQIWHLLPGARDPALRELAGTHSKGVLALATYRCDSATFVASSGYDRRVITRGLDDAAAHAFPALHSNYVLDLCVAEDITSGTMLITASADGTVRYWPVQDDFAASGVPIRLGKVAVTAVCAASLDGEPGIAAGRADGGVDWWPVKTPDRRVCLRQATGQYIVSLSRMALSETSVLVSLTRAGVLEIIEPGHQANHAQVRIGEHGVSALGMPGGQVIAAHDAHWTVFEVSRQDE